ncbi:MAG: ADP-ribosylglycohydrolase family protein [Planctomycetota bacterium]
MTSTPRMTQTPSQQAGDANPLEEWSRRLTWIGGVDLSTEYQQAQEEGRDLGTLRDDFERLLAVPRPDATWFPHRGGGRDEAWQDRANLLLDTVQRCPIRDDYPYDEPDDLPGILAKRPDAAPVPAFTGSEDDFRQRLHGGLLGRLCGCLLGKPSEGHDRRSIRIHAEQTGNWPITRYLDRPTAAQRDAIAAAGPDRMPKEPHLKLFRGEIDGMVLDDDVNYTVLGHAILATFGSGFRPHDVAYYWLGNLPMRVCCTAERIAYRNFANAVLPPRSASYRNPCREWIGADIRADYYGYANPGKPRRAAEWAHRDASISHVRNGIYGSMWVAAMLAAAYVLDDLEAVIHAGLAQIPQRCRLAEAVRRLIAMKHAGANWDAAVDSVHARWDETDHHGWCHTISNAEVLTAALLWGDGDYSDTICKAVMAGFDTDCNAATAGSIWGVMHGVDAIPRPWADPLRDRGVSSIPRWPAFTISGLAHEMADTAVREGALS